VKKASPPDAERSERLWDKAQFWTRKKQQGEGEEDGTTRVMWIRDLLVPMFKDARIATYSYESDWTDPRVKTSLPDCANQFLNILKQRRQRAGVRGLRTYFID
jgi:hypothetical protein